MSDVKRIYVEKRTAYATEANEIKHNLIEQLGLEIDTLRIINRYDVQGVSDGILKQGINTILAEPMVDDVYQEEFPTNNQEVVFAIEFLPGQYDQRADSCEQCFAILTGNSSAKVKCARVFAITFKGDKDEILTKIQSFLINPVDQRLASLEKPADLNDVAPEIKPVPTINGFNELDKTGLEKFLTDNGMAMNYEDLKVTQDYFKNEEKRDPTEAELKVLDTYWSDHCRHTTFATVITDLDIENGAFKEILEKDIEDYKTSRHLVYGIDTKRPLTLMDLATISMKELRKTGYLDDLEVSEEINACSVEITVHTTDGDEQWLLMFKNETHNHPTEIEPFGGAATCLGGAIRDPLSGRAYVYQSMRITGAGDPRKSLAETMAGKLPQRKLCQESAHGFSSYGNQIGLTTGYVHEIYDDGYVAKRMELGAVVAAAPKEQVKRLEPLKDHIVLLIGGRTGRDVSEKVVRCNDFGAGGVCVAVGELAPGLVIDLDAVLKKYEGLTGTELAISESQERMAIVIDEKDADFIKAECAKENLEVVQVAVVTDQNRLVMKHMGEDIVNISRDFLDAAGAKRYQDVKITLPDFEKTPFDKQSQTSFVETVKETLSKLSVASQKGLIERFDSSIGNGTVLSPFGGIKYHTETEGMAALIPVLGKETTTASVMTYGYNPLISKWSPYHGAMYAIVESVAKIVAMGGNYHTIRFSFQEYFEKLLDNPITWGKPTAALLGAYRVQSALKLASIGGKDSMSGTFQDIDVPPTLVSFAVDVAEQKDIITPELKAAGNKLVWLRIPTDEYDVPKYDQVMELYGKFREDVQAGRIVSAYALDRHGIAAAVSKMAFGNRMGVKIDHDVDARDLFVPAFGDIVAEVPAEKVSELAITYTVIGEVTEAAAFTYKDMEITEADAEAAWKEPLEKVFPTNSGVEGQKEVVEKGLYNTSDIHICSHKIAQPTVFIPVFPGTNCEFDSKKAFERAGAKTIVKVFKNMSAEDILDSVDVFEKAIAQSQIIMFPGGFSAGDEPDGSAKFFATAFQNAKMKEAVEKLLNERDGLVLGVCNGFQALIKLGLVPNGEITGQTADSPTLTYNTIGRHISKMVYTKVVTNKSPWLQGAELGGVYTNPASHGEGRFVASKEWIDKLFANGQVATQYCDPEGNITMNEEWNVNGSYCAIEGITSPDGRVFGKMAHSERRARSVAMNIYGEQDLKIFESGVKYFK